VAINPYLFSSKYKLYCGTYWASEVKTLIFGESKKKALIYILLIFGESKEKALIYILAKAIHFPLSFA
jgi:flagellar assembly factor FliW